MPQARDEAGNVWEVDAQGNPIRLLQSAQGRGSVMSLPRSPEQQAQAAATQAGTQGKEIDNRISQATAGAAISKAGSDAVSAQRSAATAGLPEGFMWAPDGKSSIPIPGYTRQGLSPEVRQKALAQWESASTLDNVIKQLEQLYAEGPGKTKGIGAVKDYLPTTENQRFDRAANAARGIVRNALGLTGGEANTAAEAQMNLGAYIPQSSDRDQTILDSIDRLKTLANQARSQSTATLGGTPDANGVITPTDDWKSVWQQTYIGGGQGPEAAPPGSPNQLLPVEPRMQAELDAYIQQNAGRLDPNALQNFIGTLYAKYGGNADPTQAAEYAGAAASAAQRGGMINTRIPGRQVPLSGIDALRNNLVNNPAGAAATGFADAVGLGIPTALAPEQMSSLSDASTGNAIGMGAGQILGAIAGTEGLGMFGRQAASRIAPSLLGGGVKSAMARNLATDSAYSGIYGANQGNDPLSSALLGTAGSLVGSGLAKAGGAAIGGLAASDAANYLRSRGIPLTVGQMLGGIPKRIEDAAMSAPGVGDVISNRRMEGLNAFNQAAFQDAGAPIGFNPTAIRRQGIDQLLGPEGTMGQGAVSNAYDQATAGVSVPLDRQFMADMGQVAGLQTRLPSDYAARFDKVDENRIAPIVDSGVMTGEGYQQAMRGLKGSRASAAGAAPGFEQEYRDALTASMDALRGNMQRQGGQGVIDALGQADQANRYAKTLEDAVKRARNGSRSGEVQVFTPSQLVDAGTLTASRYPGPRPFASLADAGQEVLPSRVPDSGTARRLSQLALPGVLGGAGYTLDRASGDDGMGGVLSGLGTAALLAAGGTKGGQKALQNVIFVRPEALRAAGRAIGQRSGMFGAGFIPLALPLANQ